MNVPVSPAITIVADNIAPPVPATSVRTEHPHSLTGDIWLYRDFPAKSLSSRNVLVYLPPGYITNGHHHYPVLYLQDGQNCFDGATSFIPNKEWQVDETVERLIRAGLVEPLIMVAIYNTGVDRVNEYTPVKDDLGRGGRGEEYARWMVEELKPFIDRTYRTRKDAESTAICGSSLGGLFTLYLGFRYPNTFHRLAALSPSVWWADRAILQTVRDIKKRPPLKIWLDVGTHEGFTALPDTERLRDELVARGWKLNEDFAYMEADGADHSEVAWGARMETVLRFLFPAKK